MRYLMNLMTLKKVSAVVAAVGIATCLVPEPAQAQRAGWSGRATNTRIFNFDLDTAVPDGAGTDDSAGYFPGAIENFNISAGGSSDSVNSFICGSAVCPPGDLTVTKLTADSSGRIPGLSFGLNGLQQIFDSLSPSGIDFSNNVLRYDVTFVGTSPEPDLIWFIQSSDSSLINDLSGLSQFNTIRGIFPRDVAVFDGGGINNSGIFNLSLEGFSQQVPEPTAIVGLLGIGTLSAVSLLKRNKSLKKTV